MPSRTLRVNEVVGLAGVLERGVNVAVLDRPVVSAVASYAEAVAATGEATHAAIVTPDSAFAQLASLLPAGAGRQELLRDIVDTVEIVTELSGAERIGVRVISIDRPMCPRFHVDHVLLRAVTTYAGPATEFVDDDDVDRDGLRSDYGSHEHAMLKPGAAIQRARPFDIVVLKGEAFPGNEGGGIVHRSPAVATAAPRLFVTYDTMFDA